MSPEEGEIVGRCSNGSGSVGSAKCVKIKTEDGVDEKPIAVGGLVVLTGKEYQAWKSYQDQQEVKKSQVKSRPAKLSYDIGPADQLELNLFNAVQLMDRAEVNRFDGTPKVDTNIWLSRFRMAMMTRWIHPGIFHRVAIQWISGLALKKLEAVLGTNLCPANWPAFCEFLLREFPPTITKVTIRQKLDNFKQLPGESASGYFDRFSLLVEEAKQVAYAIELREQFILGLNPTLKSFVEEQLIKAEKPNEIPLDTVALWAVLKDQKQMQLGKTNNVDESSGSNKRRKTNLSARQEERLCYNCGKTGHIFNSLQNPTCPYPITEGTKTFFQNKRVNG